MCAAAGRANARPPRQTSNVKVQWQAIGKPALMTAAWTDPVGFVRVVASLIPRELEATATVVHADRMSDDELAAIACQGGEDPLAAEEDEEILQPVG